MAQLDRIALNAEADIIKNEVTDNANTALRVGQMLNDLADSQSNLIDDPSGGGVIPQVYEAVVSFDGNDSTGAVGGLPFLTPTAAAAALRAYVGTQRLMTIKAGIYVGEDCLFADGIISCEDGVTLQTGDTNAMFENIDGSYDNISFQLLGNPKLKKIGTKEPFNITTTLNNLIINANDDGEIDNTIKSLILFVNSPNISLGSVTTVISFINVSQLLGDFNIILNDFVIPSRVIINIGEFGGGNMSISGDSLSPTVNLNVTNFFSGVSFTADCLGELNLNFKSILYSSSISLSSNGNGGIYNLSGNYKYNGLGGSPMIEIADNSLGTFNFKGKYTHENNGEIIDCGTAQTVNIIGVITMLTTADPKVGINITLNNIIDVPGIIQRDITANINTSVINFTGFDKNKIINIYYQLHHASAELEKTWRVDYIESPFGFLIRNQYLYIAPDNLDFTISESLIFGDADLINLTAQSDVTLLKVIMWQ